MRGLLALMREGDLSHEFPRNVSIKDVVFNNLTLAKQLKGLLSHAFMKPLSKDIPV